MPEAYFRLVDACDGTYFDAEDGEREANRPGLVQLRVSRIPLLAVLGAALVGMAASSAPAGAVAALQVISSASDGTPAVYTNSNGRDSVEPTWSPDGSRVAFSSDATNLVTAGVSGQQEIYVKDRLTGTTTLVSAGSDGTPGTSDSLYPTWNPEGGDIAFLAATPTNLVAGPYGSGLVILVKDLATSSLTSFPGADGKLIGSAYPPVWSPDGTKLAFASAGGGIVSGGTTHVDIYILDISTGSSTLVSQSITPTPGDVGGNANSTNPVWSPDGTRLAFQSDANNLAPGIVSPQVYVYDVAAGSLTVASASSRGDPSQVATGTGSTTSLLHANVDNRTYQQMVWNPSSTALLFQSNATNLVATSLSGNTEIFEKNLATGALTLVSSSSAGTAADGLTQSGMWSPDGTAVAFSTGASNLTTEGVGGVFVKTLNDGSVSLFSRASDGSPMSRGADWPVWSPDGAWIAFYSQLSPSNDDQLFARNTGTGQTVLVSAAPDGTPGDNTSSPQNNDPVWSPDSSQLAFESLASNLVTSPAASGFQIYSWSTEGAVNPPPPTPSLTLSPKTGSDPTGNSHTLTALVEEGLTPQVGVAITFAVTAGPCQGKTGSATTNLSGNASYSYNCTMPGTDIITATATVGSQIVSDTAIETWFVAHSTASNWAGSRAVQLNFRNATA